MANHGAGRWILISARQERCNWTRIGGPVIDRRLAEDLALDALPSVGHKIILARWPHLSILTIVKKTDRCLLELARDERWRMGFDYDRVRI